MFHIKVGYEQLIDLDFHINCMILNLAPCKFVFDFYLLNTIYFIFY